VNRLRGSSIENRFGTVTLQLSTQGGVGVQNTGEPEKKEKETKKKKRFLFLQENTKDCGGQEGRVRG